MWNTTLFDTFIPRAWATFLQLLSANVPPVDTAAYFHAWPPVVQQASGGDPYYWQNVGLHLLQILAEEQQPVWPVAGSDSYAALSEVLVGKETDLRYVPALVAAGVNVTIPHERILRMIQISGANCQMLTPENIYEVLLVRVLLPLALCH